MTGEYEKIAGFPPELKLDGAPGPAARLAKAKTDAMIENALLAAGFGAEQPTYVAPPIAPVHTLEKRGRRFALWQTAAAAVIAFAGIGSASAAVMWWAKQQRLEPTVEQLTPPKPLTRKQKTAPVKPVVVSLEETEVTPITLDEIELSPPDPRARTRKPEDWLEDANRLRAQKKWKEADENYARVWQAAPNSDAAYVARVASAGVRLEHLHDARAALARYKSALKVSPKGPLSEEARYGISEAYRAMGDRQAELEALRTFIEKHPSAGLTLKAKKRMLQLEAER